jgi:hypothetical protein
MVPMANAWLCQIDVTSVCCGGCSYCSRFTRHIRKDQHFNMPLDFLDKALESLEDWPSKIGIIGGEPTLHPEFEGLCEVVKSRCKGKKWVELFSMGGKAFERHKKLIDETFDMVEYNDHSKPCKHQPITMAAKDVVPDEKFREWLIDNCWVQRIWCPTISVKGAFFCEVAYGIDHILDGPGGWPVEKGWWRRTPPDYKCQMWACQMCGMPVPMKGRMSEGCERVSMSVFKEYLAHGLLGTGLSDVVLDRTTMTKEECMEEAKDWAPGNYKPGTSPGGFK